MAVFKTLLKMEIERQKLSGQTSVISYLNLMLCPKTLKKHHDHFDEFIGGLGNVIKNQLRSSEMITFLNDGVFLVITPQSTTDEMDERLSQLKERTLAMVQSACDGSKNDEMVFETFEISGNNDSGDVLDEINKRINIF